MDIINYLDDTEVGDFNNDVVEDEINEYEAIEDYLMHENLEYMRGNGQY